MGFDKVSGGGGSAWLQGGIKKKSRSRRERPEIFVNIVKIGRN
jgi:hypothetical protein